MPVFPRRRLDKQTMVAPDEALPGRDVPMAVQGRHAIFDMPLLPPFSKGNEQAVFAMGCFWGAEKRFWVLPGVTVTAVGYTAGFTSNPTYEEVCSGQTGHTEAVLVVFDPGRIGFEALLRAFWEGHDPTQGMRQGNDIGTQYRSGIYPVDSVQRRAAEASRDHFQRRLAAGGLGSITTEIVDASPFYYAEDYHQQYLADNPLGYCGLGGTGVSFE
jgi:peptide-methionine (S)-S-oxide reductase